MSLAFGGGRRLLCTHPSMNVCSTGTPCAGQETYSNAFAVVNKRKSVVLHLLMMRTNLVVGRDGRFAGNHSKAWGSAL